MTRRTDRVAEAIKRLASEILMGELKDPRLAGFITITKTRVTPDLKIATIFYSVLGDDKEKKLIMSGLESAKNFMRKRISDELKLRYTPEIVWKLDDTIEKTKSIDRILEKIHKEKEDESDKKNSQNN